jgi:hypothetical protein
MVRLIMIALLSTIKCQAQFITPSMVMGSTTPVSGGSSVTLAIVDTASAAYWTNDRNTLVITKTLSSTTAGCLVALLTVWNGSAIDSIKVGSYKMTADSSKQYGSKVLMYHLLNPPSGSQTITAYMGDLFSFPTMYLINLRGVNQTIPFGAGSQAQAFSTSVSTNITLASGDIGIAIASSNSSANVILTANSPMTLGSKYDGVRYGSITGTATGTGTKSMSVSQSASSTMVILAIPVKQMAQ